LWRPDANLDDPAVAVWTIALILKSPGVGQHFATREAPPRCLRCECFASHAIVSAPDWRAIPLNYLAIVDPVRATVLCCGLG
jgi:hypothetical protein